MEIPHGARDQGPHRLFESGFVDSEEIAKIAELVADRDRRLKAPPSGPGMIRIVHGANEDVLPVGGQTVSRVRLELGGLFNIAPGALALVGGKSVSEDYVLAHGETLEFIESLGSKGVGRVWTQEEFCELFRMTEADFQAMVSKGLPTHRMGDGTVRITETQLDAFLNRMSEATVCGIEKDYKNIESMIGSLVSEIRRIADALNPPPPDLVDSVYIAERLGCTTTWVADMARNGEIPRSCIVPGTGNGKPWKFHRTRIDEWIARR